MQIVTHRDSNLAVYRISREGYDRSDRDRLLLHEVIHVLLDPIREEFDYMVKEQVGEGALETRRGASYRVRHDREIEKAVEHLSHVMYDQMSTPL